MVQFISRAYWSAIPPTHPPNRGPFDHARMFGVTWHHTGSTTDASGSELAHVQAIDSMAVNGGLPAGRFWDLPYTAIFTQSGDIYAGRDWQLYIGAHAASAGGIANLYTFGYAFLGNATVDILTPAAIDAMKVLAYVSTLAARHGLMHFGHRDWSNHGGISTNCPGDNLEAELVNLGWRH